MCWGSGVRGDSGETVVGGGCNVSGLVCGQLGNVSNAPTGVCQCVGMVTVRLTFLQYANLQEKNSLECSRRWNALVAPLNIETKYKKYNSGKRFTAEIMKS